MANIISPEEKRIVEQLITANVGSIPRIERIQRIEPGRYEVIDVAGTKWLVDVHTRQVSYTTPAGRTRTIRYDPSRDTRLIEEYREKMERYKQMREDLKRRIEEYNKKIEMIEAKKYPEDILHQRMQDLQREREKLVRDVGELKRLEEELLQRAPQYKGAIRKSRAHELLRELAIEEETRRQYQKLFEDIARLDRERELKAREIAIKKFKEQVQEAEKELGSIWYYLPIPWVTTTARTQKLIATIGYEGIKEIREEVEDPVIRQRAEQYYRKLASEVLKDVPERWEREMWFDTLATAGGLAVGFVAARITPAIFRLPGIRGFSKKLPDFLKVSTTEYVLDVATDIALQKTLFGTVDVGATLAYNIIDFAPVRTNLKKRVTKQLDIEEFKFERFKPEIKELTIATTFKKQPGTQFDIQPTKRELTDIRYIETPEGKLTIQTGVLDDKYLHRRVTLEEPDRVTRYEEIKQPERLYQLDVRFKDTQDSKWQRLHHLVVDRDRKSTLGVITGEIEIDVDGKKQRVRIQEPIKATVHEGAWVQLVKREDDKMLFYTIPESDLPYPTTGKILEIRTRRGPEFYEFESKRAYDKEIAYYKEFGEDKGMAVVYDPKKERGIGIDPAIQVEVEPKKKYDVEAPEVTLPLKLLVDIEVTQKQKIPIPFKKKAPSKGISFKAHQDTEIPSLHDTKFGVNVDMDIEHSLKLDIHSLELPQIRDVKMRTDTKGETKQDYTHTNIPLPRFKLPDIDIPPAPKKLRGKDKNKKKKAKKRTKTRRVKSRIIMEKILIG